MGKATSVIQRPAEGHMINTTGADVLTTRSDKRELMAVLPFPLDEKYKRSL